MVYRSNAKKFPLTAAEVAAGRLPVRTLFVSQRAERMERLLENADSRERRVGRDFDAKFSTRQASTVLPQVMMRQTAPGPIAGLRVWEPARFADVNFVDTSVDDALMAGDGLRDLLTRKPSDAARDTATRDALRAAVAQTELGQPLRGTSVASGAIQLTKQLLTAK